MKRNVVKIFARAILASLLYPMLTAAAAADAAASERSSVFVLGNEQFRVEVVTEPNGLLEKFGPRFDRTAMVRQVQLKNRSYLWRDGLTDEFGIMGLGVLGYENAGPNDVFIKVGVGELVKQNNEKYQFWQRYPIRKLLPATVHTEPNTVTVTQQSEVVNGYAYSYIKRYRVKPKSATLLIEYELTNTGKRVFSFEQYNHNWFAFEGIPIGPAYYVEPAFAVSDKLPSSLRREGAGLRLSGSKGAYLASELTAPAENNRLTVAHPATGQSVEISGDFPVARFALFADANAICPEVFARFKLAAGKRAAWKRTYRFFNSGPLPEFIPHNDAGQR